jgi:hypothetical protein
MHTYNDAIRRSIGSYVFYPGDAKTEMGKNRFERYNEIIPGIGAFAIKPRPGDGMKPEGLTFVLQFISDLLDHQLSKFTQSYRISYWTEATLRESTTEFKPRLVDFAVEGKPPKDTQVLLGFVRDDEAGNSCFETKTFFCHAIEWNGDISRTSDGSGSPGKPSNLSFDPFRSDLLVTYHQSRTGEWIARVVNVRLVSAEQRAAEIGRAIGEMKAAYYYRFQLADIRPMEARDVSSIVHRQPGEPIACNLSEFAACPRIAVLKEGSFGAYKV